MASLRIFVENEANKKEASLGGFCNQDLEPELHLIHFVSESVAHQVELDEDEEVAV
jgi:hypothetical protein